MKSQLNLNASAKEQINHKINTNLRLFINKLHSDFPPHWHTDIEIIIPKEAPYKVICAGQTFDVEIDDILLICPAVIHEIFSPAPGERVYLQADFSGIINMKELDKAFRMMSPALHVKRQTCPPEIYNKLCSYIDKIADLYFGSAHPDDSYNEDDDDSVITYSELEPYCELEIYSLLMQFIVLCAKNIAIFKKPNSHSSSTAFTNNITLSNVCAYISEHFAEDITLESISAHAGFSKFHFERIFREYTGVTFYQFLQQTRINYAQTLLSNPELSIKDISYQSGFASCSAFTRALKKCTGYPPSQFRMMNEQHPLYANPHFANRNA